MKSLFTSILLVVVFQLQGQSFEVMTDNIRFDNPGDGINQWSLRKDKLIALIKKYDPEIFGVQEALIHQLNDIQSGLEGYQYLGVGRDDGKEKGEYSAIFFKNGRFSVNKSGTFWLSETPDVPGSKSWDAAITRIATWALFTEKPSRRQFFVINTHYDHIGTEARDQSSKLLAQKAKEIAGKKPVIITGDFNCTRDEQPYKTLIEQNQIKLTDAAPANPPGTFCNFGVNSQPCRPIDYVFYSNDWQIKNYLVITDNDGKNYPSDHLPVEVTMTLTK